ncbi:A24 family peptidase [Photobacterium lipolyticum]|uniref:Prepilin type IV endopeptidase peptidase domain-containing protein n=1 Tax=Photobacterium lipolyticum TaxID=266810 RepID=A0A2T3N4I6_9GAMM|nr:prepilin peptidase [Photobacterium lipolyticum]PSW07391.1 hypothetical protein C9I89_01330 [Photobacterium lipolyticum]
MSLLSLLGLIVLYVSYSDIRYRLIPNWVCVVIFSLSLLLAIEQHQVIVGLLSTTIVFCTSLLLFYFRIIAAGDGKLAAALAAALLPGQLLNAVILTLLAGGALAAFYLIKDRLILKKKPGEDRGLPYGVAISFGFYLTIVANSI